jgi:predicted GNAT family N-acyltransferase
MSLDVTFKWINGWEADDSVWEKIQTMISAHGWPILNRSTARVLAAFSGSLIAISTVQLMPMVGPLIVEKAYRGTGIAEELADQTQKFLREADARGWVVVADSAHSEKLCRERGMEQLASPMYITRGSQSQERKQ